MIEQSGSSAVLQQSFVNYCESAETLINWEDFKNLLNVSDYWLLMKLESNYYCMPKKLNMLLD